MPTATSATPSLPMPLSLNQVLPADHAQAVLVGRIWVPGSGPVLVRVQADGVYALEHLAPTASQLLELEDPATRVRAQTGAKLADTAAVLANSAEDGRDVSRPWFLAPNDLQ